MSGARAWQEAAVSGWYRGHRRAFRAALTHLHAAPTTHAAGIAVMAIALALPAVLFVLLDQHRALFERWGEEPSLTVFLRQGAAPGRSATLADALQSRREVENVEIIPAARAFEDFAAHSGLEREAFGNDNPLPDVLVVTPRDAQPSGGQRLADEIRTLDDVGSVIVDLAWVERLAALTRLVERVVALVAALLLAGAVLVVGNTVQVAVGEQAAEIEVLMLVGATAAYVRRPFLYGGVMLGASAGVIAAIVVELVVLALAGPVAEVAAAYLSPFALHGPRAGTVLVLVSLAAGLGWAGAWLGTGRSLARLEQVH